jgi:hypothetical protein
MEAYLTVNEMGWDRNPSTVPNLEDYTMAVAEQWFYRGDALRLGNRKQFYGVCDKPI